MRRDSKRLIQTAATDSFRRDGWRGAIGAPQRGQASFILTLRGLLGPVNVSHFDAITLFTVWFALIAILLLIARNPAPVRRFECGPLTLISPDIQ
jgi:hypothetical protein